MAKKGLDTRRSMRPRRRGLPVIGGFRGFGTPVRYGQRFLRVKVHEVEVKDYLSILFERFNASLTLWTVESAVALGLVGFWAQSGINESPDAHTLLYWRLGLIAAFILFVVFNLGAQLLISLQRSTILAEALRTHKSSPLLLDLAKHCPRPFEWVNCFSQAPLWLLIALHAVIDAAVVVALWKV
jgi:hypothetical protein